MVTALLGAHGLTVGTYTSPHLERDQRADHPQRRADHRRRRWPPCSPTWPPSSRCSTSSRPTSSCSPPPRSAGSPTRRCRRAVVEVGLLGRWDATNVVDGDVAVLTNVGHDHTDGQGDWRRRIAEEKAGIIKAGATFVLGETDPDAAPTSSTRRPPPRSWRRDVDFACDDERARRRRSAARPAHARRRATTRCSSRCTARTRATTPPSRWPRPRRSSGGRSTPTSWSRRFAAVRNPGRFEVVQRDPLVDPRRRPQPRRRRSPRPRRSPRGSPSRASRTSSSACSTAAIPRELLELLDAEDAADRRVLHARLAARAAGRRARRRRPRALGGRPVVVDDVAEALERALDARRRPTTSCSSPARSTPSVPRARVSRASGWSKDRVDARSLAAP